MRILWFNWRDIKHPDAGGAEVFTHETMRRLVKKGYDMTLFTARFPDGLTQEEVDGINVIRCGSRIPYMVKQHNIITNTGINMSWLLMSVIQSRS